MTNYRNTTQILSDVLLITNSGDRNGVAVTKLCHKANISHGRLKKLLGKLTETGLVNKIEYDGKHTFVVTPRGKMFLERYRQFADFADAYGVEM
jgi:predicted transcriptional regulator